MMADSNLRQKLARCTNERFSFKERHAAIKVAFGGIQEADARKTIQMKTSLFVNGATDTLTSLLRCEGTQGPILDHDMVGHDIFDKNAPEKRYKYTLQASAALYMRRMLEIGESERVGGFNRVRQFVDQGCIDVLVPHLFCTAVASQYASGALAEIAKHSTFRPLIVSKGALKPLCQLLTGDVVVERTSFRCAATCVHLLSCSETDGFEAVGVLEACLNAAVNPDAGDKTVIMVGLAAANIAAGRDSDPRIETLFRKIQIGAHILRALHTSTLANKGGAYLGMNWSQLDILKSVALVAASESGRDQLVSARVKDENSSKQLNIADILCKLFRSAAETNQSEIEEAVQETLLHLAFDTNSASMIRGARGIPLLQSRAAVDERSQNILFVLNEKFKNPEQRPQRQAATSIRSQSQSQPRPLQGQGQGQGQVQGSEQGVEESVRPASGTANSEGECASVAGRVVGGEDGEGPLTPQSQSSAAPPSPSPPPPSQQPQAPTARRRHVMISYCWAQQPLILELSRRLKASAIPYWLDVEQMHGNVNDRMAEAIEGAALVLVAVSSRYKVSANCRMEAEYSGAQRKLVVPLMAESSYRPDGWLGLLISGKLWYDVSSVDEIDKNIDVLLSGIEAAYQQLGEEGLTTDPVPTAPPATSVPATTGAPTAATLLAGDGGEGGDGGGSDGTAIRSCSNGDDGDGDGDDERIDDLDIEDDEDEIVMQSFDAVPPLIPTSTPAPAEGGNIDMRGLLSSAPQGQVVSMDASIEVLAAQLVRMEANLMRHISEQLGPIVGALQGLDRRIAALEITVHSREPAQAPAQGMYSENQVE